MEYRLAIENAPSTIPGGTGLLLLHPSIGETDRIDTEFLKTDTDYFLVISTRTTAREVEQKLEHYDVDESRAVILDTLSVDRGYSRRKQSNVHYVSAPDDIEGIVSQTRDFLESHDGKVRISVDSLTEMAYYADEDRVYDATQELLALLEDHDAVGLFHLSKEVHDEETLDRFRALFDGTVDLTVDGGVTVEYEPRSSSDES
jgi:KaiC/GvpD/RAD55 family RecA-like ATPase